jgi:hypothetical protein
MEPLKPEAKERLLQDNPQAEPGEVEEYERLLSERFTVDPDMPKAPEASAAEDERESRLQELFQKFYRQPQLNPRPR